MGKMISKNNIIAVALLYRQIYVGTDMLLCDKIDRFAVVLEHNLDELGSASAMNLCDEIVSELYFTVCDEKGNFYAVLNPKVDIKAVWDDYINSLPIELYIAGEMDNALKEIDLIHVNGKIVDRVSYYNELRDKYNLLCEFVPAKFEIFRDWENVIEGGFVENYCISPAEQLILNELRENKKQNEALMADRVNTLKRVRR